jgi:hypothetical protein
LDSIGSGLINHHQKIAMEENTRFSRNLPVEPQQTFIEQPVPQEGTFNPLPFPSSELTSTVLLGAMLALLGNKFLTPLFSLIIDNFKSDQKSTGDMVNLLKERITLLEQDKAKQLVDQEKYLEALTTANQQAVNIARILDQQALGLEKLSEGLLSLRQEMLKGHADIQAQLDLVTKPKTRAKAASDDR